MAEYDDKVFARLIDIANRHSDCLNDYDKIISVCPKRLMSRGIALYGMFYPDMEISKYFLYKGKLTKRENSKNYAYYFDEDDKLRLTERYGDHKDEMENLLNLIFFYYYENTTEIVWYNTTEKTITITGYIDYNNGKISKYVETDDISRVIESNKSVGSYREFQFDVDPEYVIGRNYILFRDGSVMETAPKMKKQ